MARPTTTRNCNNFFKILLIGDSGVGKSALFLRYLNNSFNSTFIPTIGIDFKLKTMYMYGKVIKVQIWDTAGRDKFHSIITSYYQGIAGAMLVYDITNEESFQHLEKWFSNLEKFGPAKVVKLLIGNKCDLEDRRMISYKKGSMVAFQNKALFVETSARKSICVDFAFQLLIDAILLRKEEALKRAQQKASSSWISSVASFLSLRKKRQPSRSRNQVMDSFYLK